MAFKTGDRVVCLNEEGWTCMDREVSIKGPKGGDMLNIESISPDGSQLTFVEWTDHDEFGCRNTYHYMEFRKVEPFKTSVCSQALANKAQEQLKEYDPQEVPVTYPEKSPAMSFFKLGMSMRILQNNDKN